MSSSFSLPHPSTIRPNDMSDSPLSPTVSPLLEADPNSINELIKNRIDDIFNKPPLSVSDDELRIQIDYFRKERHRFLLESQQQKTPRAKVPAGAKKKTPTSVDDVISDLLG